MLQRSKILTHHLLEDFSNTLYMTIGNHTIFTVVNSSGEGDITLTDINLTKHLNYSLLELLMPLAMAAYRKDVSNGPFPATAGTTW